MLYRKLKPSLVFALTLVTALTFLTGASVAAALEETIEVSSGELLEVDLKSGGSVEVVGWDLEQVQVRTKYADQDEVVSVERTDRGVRVSVGHSPSHSHSGRRSWRNRDGHGGRRVGLVINVPSRFDLKIDTMGGGVEIRDVEGRIEGETMGGELRFTRLKGRLDFETMGGNIELTDSEVDGSVQTMGGRVELRDVRGDVKGSSMGGNVVYKNVTRRDGSSTGERVVISTMGGQIEVDEAPAGAELETMGGQIRVGSAAEFVDAETMGGNIWVGQVDGWVDVSTMGGDVDVTMVGDPSSGKRDVDISSMGGEIDLVVPAGLDMTVQIDLTYTKKHQGKYSIDSDFPLEITEDAEWDYDHGTARKVIRGSAVVGSGTHRVHVSTINGNIRLKSGG